MARINRRRFLHASALLPAAGLVPAAASAQTPAPKPAPPDVTGILARYIVAARF